MKTAIVIPLEFWQDPQSDVILVYSEQECSLYFRCWSSAGVSADFIGKLSFTEASAVRSYLREFPPYEIKLHERSYILKVEDSDLALEYADYRKLHYPRTPLKEMTHYVVVGHDIYHEILASSFEAVTIYKNQITDSSLRKLVTSAGHDSYNPG
jgi:hypothetical protein